MIIVSTILIIPNFCLSNDKNCNNCHKSYNYAGHKNISCISCHPKNNKHFSKGDLFSEGARGCLTCHSKYQNILNNKMYTKEDEKNYIKQTYAKYDKDFYKNNCNKCHVTSCSDCHIEDKKHRINKKISIEKCLNCHNGYFTGIEYVGLAEKDDNEKFDIGIEKNGKFYQKMIPDIHFEKGLACKDCHTMVSFVENKKTAKNCRDCHKKISKNVIEHKIESHLVKLNCNLCHSAWQQNEFGTNFIKFKNENEQKNYYLIKNVSKNYKKTSYMKNNFETFMGIDNSGKYNTIRPLFVSFLTFIDQKIQNYHISSDWKSQFSHTIRRETVLCQNCHEEQRKSLLLNEEDDIINLKKDKIPIGFLYNSKKHTIRNGRFVDDNIWKIKNTETYKKYFILKQIQLQKVIKDAK